jgi:hypothetical protein
MIVNVPSSRYEMGCGALDLILGQHLGQATCHGHQVDRASEALLEVWDANPVSIGHRSSQMPTQLLVLGIFELVSLGCQPSFDKSSVPDRPADVWPTTAEEEPFAVAEAHQAETAPILFGPENLIDDGI